MKKQIEYAGFWKRFAAKIIDTWKNEDYILFNSLKSSPKKLDFTPLCSTIYPQTLRI